MLLRKVSLRFLMSFRIFLLILYSRKKLYLKKFMQ